MDGDTLNKREFQLRYVGARFEGAKLPVDVLSDLPAFRDLIAAFAKEIWRRENADRKRLPRGFEQALTFDLIRITEGSAIPAIAWDRRSAQQNLPGISDYLEDIVGRAHQKTMDIIAFAERPQQSVRLPKDVVRALDRFGSSLRENERVEFVGTNDAEGRVISLDAERRRRIIKNIKETYESRVFGQGILTGLSVEHGWIEIQTDALGAFNIPIDPAEVHEIFDGNTLQPIQYDLSVQFGREDEFRSVLAVYEVNLIDEEIDTAIKKASARIDAIRALPHGWQDGEGEEINSVAADNVLQLVARRTSLASKFHIYPTLEGGVQIEFETSDWDLGIEMLPDGKIELYGVHLTSDREIAPTQFSGLTGDFLASLDSYVRD